MPIQKFRSLDEMRLALLHQVSGDALVERVRELWQRSWHISPRVYPRGVFKYRTIEEAQSARYRITTENIQRLQDIRRKR